ncbi:MAG: DUF58 domain-containing protein [Pseudomonadota bacterium]
MRAALVPDLLVEAHRIANTVVSGWHGRKRRGSGDSFWQFRPYDVGESMARIDWRRSARDDSVFVRDQEWEAAHTVWVWADNSPSMLYRSERAAVSKQSRALVLAFALTEILSRSGERVGWPGVTNPIASRRAAERIAAEISIANPSAEVAFPATEGLRGRSELVVFSDFLEPVDNTVAKINAVARQGIRGTLVHIIDPAEHTFPFRGRTEFRDPETGSTLTFGRAETISSAYINRFRARQDVLAERCRKLGWNHLVHTTDTLASTALVAVHTRLSGMRG